ncbi:MAG: orotate phosphoribosyltransferase [Candidatus Rokuibacteriota bacterium]|nr:MAG: orotate phosphoribosyltransferase [Candidatus Rokubacteria bacterium]
MTERETLALYEKTGALLRGHFRLTSGLHSDVYLQSALVLQYPEHAAALGATLAASFRDARVATVLAPAIGGILVAHEVARALDVLARHEVERAPGVLARHEVACAPGVLARHEVARALGVRALFTERENGVMRLRRGFTLSPGERCLVVEDVITTGGSTREVIACVEEARGVVVGVGSLIDRSSGAATFGVTHVALAAVAATNYSPETCPLCRAGSQPIKPGSRA